MTVALYARVSTRDKDQNPETQLMPLRDWAVRQNFTAVEYVDHASGGNLDRPGWQAMMADVRRGKLDVVAVIRLDRAFRSVADMHMTFSELEGRGVRFAAVTQPVDTGTPVGRLLVNVLGSVAEFERDIIQERVREGLARARREGKRLGRPRTPLSARRVRAAVAEHGSVAAAARALGLPRSLVRRRLAENPPPATDVTEAT